MKILFLLLQKSDNLSSSDMYSDLASQFVENGHQVTIMAPDVNHESTFVANEGGFRVVRVNSKPTQDVNNLIKKGIALALLPYYFRKTYKKFLRKEQFDWIVMPTPPITLIDFVSYLKKKNKSKFYLILRDIHPQSVASIGLLHNKFMYNYLAKRAKIGYDIADLIGCMSQGNIYFIKSNYPSLNSDKLVLLYNWMKQSSYTAPIIDIKEKYGVRNKIVALFGGTIGLGQRVENIYDIALHYKEREDFVIFIVGKGVAKDKLKQMTTEANLNNIKFVDFLPREEYLDFVKSADIGLVSINEKYAVPTCPSKAVSYMALKIPIFAMINPNSDYGKIIENAGAGYWCVGSNKENAYSLFDKMIDDSSLRKKMGENGYQFYNSYLTDSCAYDTMIKQMIKYGKA